ncbi:MAG: alpha/beta fold hydrolase [Proteobacteria bacterium]|nr:alpha/beta fold hydrolase [Pseudomonadota bacterium]
MKKPYCCLFLQCLLGSFALAPTMTQAQESVQEKGISLETCELVVPGTPLSAMAECGWLEVAENPAEPEGKTISIRVARVPATGRTAEPDPLIFFAGGPGQAATETWPIVAGGLRKLNESRDILLIDQRGTGQSNPLRCPNLELEELLAFDWDDLAKSTRECLAALDSDPRYYTTTIAMQDFDKVRAALGYASVNLFGVSYGTRAAQVYLRLFPARVRTMVLDSVVPQTLALVTDHAQNLDHTLYRVLKACDQDSDCHEAFPDSAQKLSELIEKLDETPVEVTVTHPTTGKPHELIFDREVMASSLRFLTYTSETQAMLPLLVYEAATENHFERLASQMLIAATGLQQSISQGMELSVICAEDFPFFPNNSDNSQYLMGDLILQASAIQCGIWPADPVPAGFHEPVRSDIPVLLLSGELDPVTPPRYAEQLLPWFPNATHLIAPGQGHSITGRGCLGKLVSEFIIAGSMEELDTSCIEQLQSTPYFISLTGPKP